MHNRMLRKMASMLRHVRPSYFRSLKLLTVARTAIITDSGMEYRAIHKTSEYFIKTHPLNRQQVYKMHEKAPGHKDDQTACKDIARKVQIFTQAPSVHDDEVCKNDSHIDSETDPDNKASVEVAEIIIVSNYAILMNIQN